MPLPLETGGALYQSLSICLGFDLLHGHTLEAHEAFKAASEAIADLGDCAVLDTGMPKRQPEWLMAGNVPLPPGKGGRQLVEVVAGPLKRQLVVRGGSGTPQADTVPLLWQNTYGGPKNPENPLGFEQPGNGPGITDVAAPEKTPACTAPRGAWPCRMQGMGTYDAAWLKSRGPVLADDCDFRFTSLAQPQQRFKGKLEKGMPYSIAGMHPKHPVISGKLPDTSLKAIAIPQKGEETVFALSADTLWFFPNQLAGMLFWHVLIPCRNEIASDIAEIRIEPAPDMIVLKVAAVIAGAAVLAGGAKLYETLSAGVAIAEALSAPPPPPPPQKHGLAPEQAEAPTKAAPETRREDPEPERPGESAASQAKKAPFPEKKLDTPGQETLPDPVTETAPETDKSVLAKQLEAECNQLMQESIPEIDKVLAELGFPPVNPEQIADAQKHIAFYSNLLTETEAALQASEEKTGDELAKETLRNYGISDEVIAKIEAASSLEMPDSAEFASDAAFQASLDGYFAELNEFFPVSESVRDEIRLLTSIVDKVEAEAGTPPAPSSETAELQALLCKAGMSPENAAALTSVLENDLESDDLQAFGARAEAAGGLEPGSVNKFISQYEPLVEEIERQLNAEEGGFSTSSAEPPSVSPPAKDREVEPPSPETAPPEKDRPGQLQAEPPQPPEAAPEAALLEEKAAAAGTADGKAKKPAMNEARKILAEGGSLRGANLAGADLRGMDFSKQNLSGTDFSGAMLEGAAFAGATLAGALLAGANAFAASFVDADLSNAFMQGLLAEGVDFSGANLQRANLCEAMCKDAVFEQIKGADLVADRADFTGALFQDASLAGASFAGCRAHRTIFYNTDASGSSFAGADMQKSAFYGRTELQGANFSKATLENADWAKVNARNANFQGVKASGGIFADAVLANSNWNAALLRNANFSRSDLQGASFSGADLLSGSLRESMLQGADLTGANLYKADVHRAVTNGATTVKNAMLDCTLWGIKNTF